MVRFYYFTQAIEWKSSNIILLNTVGGSEIPHRIHTKPCNLVLAGGTKVMSGLHIATSMHYRCLSLKQGLHSTPISLGAPVRNLDSLFLIFFPLGKKQLGVVQVALLITFALPKFLWQSSHFLLRTRKKSPRDYMGLGYVNTEN